MLFYPDPIAEGCANVFLFNFDGSAMHVVFHTVLSTFSTSLSRYSGFQKEQKFNMTRFTFFIFGYYQHTALEY